MTSKSPGPQKCRLILHQTLAIQLSRPGNGNIPEDFWMYDSGYMVFQNFLAANSQWWNASLIAATRALKYVGYIAPGMLLVTADPCALEILRNAYSRSVLKPPSTYIINFVGDIEDCIVMPTVQGQFTPLPEALCDIIMDLTAQGQSATMENIRSKLTQRFSHMRTPSPEMVYDSLVQLNQERKIYQTAKGYFIVTPERRRSRSRPREANSLDGSYLEEDHHPIESRTMLLSNSEALYNLYGEISTQRDGDLTHQCIQTNLADVICGGNPNDKVLYARSSKRRSSSFPNRSLERRHSLRIFGSTKRLQRSTSTRSLSKNYSITVSPDSSSSEYQSTTEFGAAAQPAPPQQQQRPSLLSRLFRRSGRQKTRQADSYSAFPPTEWFNTRTVHLHNVGTQTNDQDLSMSARLPNSAIYDGSEISQSSTLPRRDRRHISSDSTFMIWSRDCSPIRRSPHYSSGSLPRSINSNQSASKPKSRPAEESVRAQQRHRLDEKINQHFRNMQSGPSSLESAKTSTALSGPSSIDSGKNSSSRTTSCMSSLESNGCGAPSIRSLRLNGGGGAHASNHAKDDLFMPSVITSSMSNNSITLQVTTTTGSGGGKAVHSTNNRTSNATATGSFGGNNRLSTCRLDEGSETGSETNSNSTKIYVQSSPARSVIKLENGKLADNANVVIINKNETTAGNTHKEVIQYNTLRNASGAPSAMKPGPLETQFDVASGPDGSLYMHAKPPALVINNQLNKFADEHEDHPRAGSLSSACPMNNITHRKLSLQTSTTNGANLIYKNLLRQNSDRQQPLSTERKKWYAGELECCETGPLNNRIRGSSAGEGQTATTPLYGEDPKPLNTGKSYSQNTLHEVAGDTVNESLGTSNNYLSKLKSLNSIDSLATIYQKSKSLVTVGSEPNLVDLKAVHNKNDKLNNMVARKKETNLAKSELDPAVTGSEDMYDFPSLTDLSFNSLAALKILQELNSEKVKPTTTLPMCP